MVAGDAYDVAGQTCLTLRADYGRALRAFLAKPDNDTYLALAAARQRDETALSIRLVVAYYTREAGALDVDFPVQSELSLQGGAP